MSQNPTRTLVGLNEGTPVVPPGDNGLEFEEAQKAFFGNLYDFREDNRKKNHLLMFSIVANLFLAFTFMTYVKKHADVQLRVIDSSQVHDVPFRVIEFDNAVKGAEGLYTYFFSLITQSLFSYNRNTLFDNRKMAADFLDSARLQGLEQNTDELISEFTKFGRFRKGNPHVDVKNVIFLEKKGDIKTIQVYADISYFDEGGGQIEEPKTHLITYKFRNQIPKSKDEILRLNPLGIQIVEWTYQEVLE